MKTLRQALAVCKTEQIQEINSLWAITNAEELSITQTRLALLNRMQDPLAARFAWEYLSQDERQVLQRVLSPSLRNGVQFEQLQKKSKLPIERLEVAITNLKRYLLLQEEAMMVFPFSENLAALYKVGQELTASGDRSDKPLAELLSPLNDDQLHQLMKNYSLTWNIPYYIYLRSNICTLIADVLSELEQPLNFLPNL